MSILDDAIREHLELKRAHGADDSELKRLEDEAFDPPQRPDEIDPFAEAPTEFLVSPGEAPAAAPGIGDEAARSGRRPDIADLQEAPPTPSEELAPDAPPADAEPEAPTAAEAPAVAAGDAPAEELVTPDAPPPSPADAAAKHLPPPADELPAPPSPAAADAPGAAPAGDQAEIVAGGGPDTEERHVIADQPTQMFDVQAHVDAESVEVPAAEQASPSDEELIDAAQGEPQAAPPASDELFTSETAAPGPGQKPLEPRGPDAEVAGHPPAEAEPTEEESAEFDFFNEQRLSDELDQALEAPLPPTDEHIAMPRYEDAPPAQGGIFDFESEDRYEEDPSEEAPRRHDPPSEESPRDALDPPLQEYDPPSEQLDPPSQEHEPPSEESPRGSAEPASEDDDAYDPDTGHEDVLEDTPRFLEDQPEDDDLWFEQKPPKDFDL